MSRYYLDDADVETNRTLFEAYAAEVRRLIDARLPVPAHCYILKCSHAFNVLDSRGAISTVERTRAFGRMRALSHEVAKLWVERREEMGHPLAVWTPASSRADAPVSHPELSSPEPLAFEIGVEELPSSEAKATAEAVKKYLKARLSASRLTHGPIRVHASPRRVVALIEDVEPKEVDHQQTVRGPRVDLAFDAEGGPTKAAIGFAKSQGVQVAELQRVDHQGAGYVGVVRTIEGRPAAEALAQILPEVVRGLRADVNMRWSAPDLAFSRPIRWLLALLG